MIVIFHAKFLTDGIGKCHVADNTVSEKSVIRRLLGSIEKLINQHNVARLVFLLQGTDGADADDPLHSQFLHRPNIGAMVEFVR